MCAFCHGRVALDRAHAWYEEASRFHKGKTDEVNAAAAAAAAGQNQRSMAEAIAASQQQQQQQPKEEEREDCASLHSLARSCEAVAASETDAAPAASRTPNGGEREDGGRAGEPTAAAAAASVTSDGNGNGSLEDRRNGDVRRYSAASGGGGRRPGVAGRSSSTESITTPRKSSLSISATDCADEMREVKAEAALLCGIGRAPPRRAAVDASSDNKSFTAAGSSSFSSPVGDTRKFGRGGLQRSSSSSPGGAGGRSHMSRTSSAPHLPALRHGGGGNGGGAFLPPALSGHPAGAAGANRGGNRLPSMAQMPGSPSASGETDSDHSDSMGGAGGDDNAIAIAPKQHQRPSPSPGSGRCDRRPGIMKTPGAGGKESWGVYPGRDGGGGRHVAPLASLAAASLRGGNGLSCV